MKFGKTETPLSIFFTAQIRELPTLGSTSGQSRWGIGVLCNNSLQSSGTSNRQLRRLIRATGRQLGYSKRSEEYREMKNLAYQYRDALDSPDKKLAIGRDVVVNMNERPKDQVKKSSESTGTTASQGTLINDAKDKFFSNGGDFKLKFNSTNPSLGEFQMTGSVGSGANLYFSESLFFESPPTEGKNNTFSFPSLPGITRVNFDLIFPIENQTTRTFTENGSTSKNVSDDDNIKKTDRAVKQ